jgi:histidinol-phosphate aminotransferase
MSFINQWLRSDIQEIQAYHVPKSKNMIKLDAMESPFLVPEDLIEPYLAYLAEAELNRYPDAGAEELQQTLRELMGIPKGLDILLGNGSDELIQLLALACDTGDTILSVEPSFVMYEMIAKFTRLNYHGVSLDENFQINLDLTLAAIRQNKPKLIFISYPNNPTGNAFDRQSIKKIIEESDAMVVVDEAYYAYAQDSFLEEICHYPNLVLLRTVSKIGFAGLRLGLLIGNSETVSHLDKLRLPYNINTLTQASANFLLKEKDRIRENAQIIIDERSRLFDELAAIEALVVYPSDANFLLVKTPDANALFAFLKTNGVLIKNFASHPQLSNCVRITVSDAGENNALLKQIKRFYG